MPTTKVPPAFASPEERYQWAHTEYEKGRTLNELAQALGVSPSRAGQMKRRGECLANPVTYWHTGLSSQTANRLLEQGYTSRDQVEQAVETGEITDRPSASQRKQFVSEGQQTTVPGLGSVGFLELRQWLECEPGTR
ncbi:hypothetical protein [Pseudomonas mosselii]|uniref:hypothetical protein n=1 Tax=Pseudomonas mosselii TaxID=78327 RepID=UPI0021D8AA78|nr:hypothetical protein [Pseudomonas mosselii]MCU9527527.1 hypothetical protein [Pseudomonas mosselii]MCU9534840.1 hypothetical protein [Pseudomonas mosselii]MCU9542774.1 hypothetical protein [Pseudomonas mosselii]MCU9546680.1 hypothetical protein [Pseudomonas mosselii]